MAWGRHWLLKSATHILGVSGSALDARFPKRENEDRFSIWSLGVDTRKFCPPDARFSKIGKGPALISVGSFIPQRRQDLVLRIYALVLEIIPEAKLLFVGEGERLKSCKALTKRLGVYDCVDFLGLREDIPDLLHEADIFVSCSEAEGLPNVLLEAQASGLPVVASDIPPHREALHDMAHRFLFTHDDIQGAADNIVRVLNDPGLSDELGRAGRQFVVEHYDAKRNLKKLEEMYLSWVSERRRSE